MAGPENKDLEDSANLHELEEDAVELVHMEWAPYSRNCSSYRGTRRLQSQDCVSFSSSLGRPPVLLFRMIHQAPCVRLSPSQKKARVRGFLHLGI